MDRKLLFVSVALVALILTDPASAAPDFSYGFEGCSERITGNDGSTVQFELFGTLTTANNASPDGAQGWSVSLAVDGGNLVTNLLKGVEVSTVYYDKDIDDDGVPEDEPTKRDPYIQELGAADTYVKVISKATLPDDPNRHGLISAVYLKNQIVEKQVLQPNGVARIFRLVVEARVPRQGCLPVTLRYEDGFKSATSSEVKNFVEFEVDGATQLFSPSLSSCTVMVCSPAEHLDKSFELSAVPAGADPSPGDGDNVLEGNVPPGLTTIDVDVVLTTRNLPSDDGPLGWALSVLNEPCLTVQKAVLQGVVVSTVYYDSDIDGDGRPEDQPTKRDRYDQDLGAPDVFLKFVDKARGSPPLLPSDAQGVVSAVVMKAQEKQVLHANTSDRILRISYEIEVSLGQVTNCKISFVDGLRSPLISAGVQNVISYAEGDANRNFQPTKRQGLLVKLTGVAVPPRSAAFVRGDPNGDGKVDIADAVAIVLNVVPGLRGPGDFEILCNEAGNANGDEGMNLVDAIYLIDWLFRGSLKPPAAPYPDCGVVTGLPLAECPPGSSICQ